MRGDYRQSMRVSRSFRRVADIYRRMAGTEGPIRLQTRRSAVEFFIWTGFYRAIPSAKTTINAQLTRNISRSRLFRIPYTITPSMASAKAISSQKRGAPKPPVQSPASSRIHTDAKALEAAIETAANPPSATPLPHSGIGRDLFASRQSNHVSATTIATKVKTSSPTSAPPKFVPPNLLPGRHNTMAAVDPHPQGEAN